MHGIFEDILLETDAKYLHENWFYTKDHISKSIKSKNLNNVLGSIEYPAKCG